MPATALHDFVGLGVGGKVRISQSVDERILQQLR